MSAHTPLGEASAFRDLFDLTADLVDGIEHDIEGCPCDDTCDCPNIARINTVMTAADDALRHDSDVLGALRDLVARCDGDEGVRADGSNIQTMRAHAAIESNGKRRER